MIKVSVIWDNKKCFFAYNMRQREYVGREKQWASIFNYYYFFKFFVFQNYTTEYIINFSR
jgi:hypothetical protein